MISMKSDDSPKDDLKTKGTNFQVMSTTLSTYKARAYLSAESKKLLSVAQQREAKLIWLKNSISLVCCLLSVLLLSVVLLSVAYKVHHCHSAN